MPPKYTDSPETLKRYAALMKPPPHRLRSVLFRASDFEEGYEEDYRTKQPKRAREKKVQHRKRTAAELAKRADQPPRDAIIMDDVAVEDEDEKKTLTHLEQTERLWQPMRDEITKEDVAAKAEVLAALAALEAAEAAGTHPKEAINLNWHLYKLHSPEHIPYVPWHQLHDMSDQSRWIETFISAPTGNGDRAISLKVCINRNSEEFDLSTCRPSTKPRELEEGPCKAQITLLGGDYLIAKIPRELALQDQSADAIAKAPEYFTFYGVNAHFIKKAKAKANADPDAEFHAKAKAMAEEVEENWDAGLERWR